MLKDCLRTAFERKSEIGPLHRLLASVESPLVIVSTNYDTLVERALQEAGKPYDLVVYPADQKRSQTQSSGGRTAPSTRDRGDVHALDRSRHDDGHLQDARLGRARRGRRAAQPVGELRDHRGGLRRVHLPDDERGGDPRHVLHPFPRPELPLPRLRPARLEPACRAAQPEVDARPAGQRRAARLGDPESSIPARAGALAKARRAHLRRSIDDFVSRLQPPAP